MPRHQESHDGYALWLLATIGLTACFWTPYVLDRFLRLGIRRTLGNPKPSDAQEQSAWARRAERAHANAVENLAVFAPLALLAIHSGLGASGLASGSAATYFFARVTHYLSYTAGVPGLRTAAFLAGFGAQMALVFALATIGAP
jgi:uncharacterized MAPEG superfamily protein